MVPQPPDSSPPAASAASAALLAQLEAISRARPDRVLRLRGRLDPAALEPDRAPASAAAALAASGGPQDRGDAAPPAAPPAAPALEPFELVIYRGFSSSTTHPTGYDPDQPALPEGALIEAAELLRGPLNPAAEQRLAGPGPVALYLEPTGWG